MANNYWQANKAMCSLFTMKKHVL